jgi:ribulose-5-phosphate 4-epimerase/fuculose-1-phosphate aldolase
LPLVTVKGETEMRSLQKLFLAAGILASACSSTVAEPTVRTDRSQPALPDSDAQRLEDLVLASRILFNEGVLDSFGHVSVRSRDNPAHFFMPRAMPPALVTAKDIIELNENADPVVASSPRPNGEKFIHGEIYRMRADVQAIVHSHAPGVIPFSLTPARPLRPVIHTAGFLPERVSVFDVRSVSKDDPNQRGKLLINNAKLGAALAQNWPPIPSCLFEGMAMSLSASHCHGSCCAPSTRKSTRGPYLKLFPLVRR